MDKIPTDKGSNYLSKLCNDKSTWLFHILPEHHIIIDGYIHRLTYLNWALEYCKENTGMCSKQQDLFQLFKDFLAGHTLTDEQLVFLANNGGFHELDKIFGFKKDAYQFLEANFQPLQNYQCVWLYRISNQESDFRHRHKDDSSHRAITYIVYRENRWKSENIRITHEPKKGYLCQGSYYPTLLHVLLTIEESGEIRLDKFITNPEAA